jgi:hypothetical protein
MGRGGAAYGTETFAPSTLTASGVYSTSSRCETLVPRAVCFKLPQREACRNSARPHTVSPSSSRQYLWLKGFLQIYRGVHSAA